MIFKSEELFKLIKYAINKSERNFKSIKQSYQSYSFETCMQKFGEYPDLTKINGVLNEAFLSKTYIEDCNDALCNVEIIKKNIDSYQKMIQNPENYDLKVVLHGLDDFQTALSNLSDDYDNLIKHSDDDYNMFGHFADAINDLRWKIEEKSLKESKKGD